MKEKLQIRAGADGLAFPLRQLLQHYAPHHHDELEVNLVLTGNANYLFGNRRVPLLPGSMIWLFPRQEHVLIDWSPDFSIWVVVFRPSLVKRFSRDGNRRTLRSADPGDIFCRQMDSRTVDFLDQVYKGASGKDQDMAFMNAALSYALVASWEAFQASSEWTPRADVHPSVAKAARLISSTDMPFSLDQLARKAGLSPARLSHLFKHQTGISLTSFRQRKCLERFLRLYRSGARHTLIEAALLAGFGSYPQFHRVFSRGMGMSPAAYKKSLNRPVPDVEGISSDIARHPTQLSHS